MCFVKSSLRGIQGVMNSKCPLCHASPTKLFHSQQKVNWNLYAKESANGSLEFFTCPQCALIFKDRNVTLPLESQKSRYLDHQNEASDDYKNFLMKLWTPLSKHLAAGQSGLDYGCGPTKVLGFIASDFQLEFYDPLFWPQDYLLEKKYDFVFCSEVVEHFLTLERDWTKLRNLLKPGGHLGVMTAFSPPSFEGWYYHNDSTHVSFYSPKTLGWIAEKFGMNLLLCKDSVAIFRG